MCRFLDAGSNETLRTQSQSASKKRQGTKSRGMGRRLSNERYGDLRLAAVIMDRVMVTERQLVTKRHDHACQHGRPGECLGHFHMRLKRVNRRSAC